jgi:hypothetical protein
MWCSLNQTGCWEGLIWNRRKNGENYPQWLNIYPVDCQGQRLFAGVFMDVGELTANNERLAALAYYDPLTELPNRSPCSTSIWIFLSPSTICMAMNVVIECSSRRRPV